MPAGAPSRTPAADSGWSPAASAARTPGWREVLVVAAGVVIVVLGAAALTGLLPTELQRFVFHTPLAILVLVAGTVLVLWRVAGRRPPVA